MPATATAPLTPPTATSEGTKLFIAQAPCLESLALIEKNLANLPADKETLNIKIGLSDVNMVRKSELKNQVLLALGLTPTAKLAQIEKALSSFQAINGLNATGKADAKTVYALLPLSKAYQQVLLAQAQGQCQDLNNKIQRDKPTRFIEVNVAHQRAIAYELSPQTQRYEPAVQTAVIVGKPTTKTPVADFKVWAVKFNPGWTPTPNILKRSAFKADGLDRQWIESHNIEIFDKDGERVDPDFVNPYNYHDFRYVEPPSRKAALGALKLETTSDQDIYMHDTPEKNKFSWNVRLASSGCIRVQNIEPLAKWVFEVNKDPAKAQQFSKALAKEKNAIKKIAEPVPVYLSYRLVDTDGAQVRWLPDVYERVSQLKPSLKVAAASAPSPVSQ